MPGQVDLSELALVILLFGAGGAVVGITIVILFFAIVAPAFQRLLDCALECQESARTPSKLTGQERFYFCLQQCSAHPTRTLPCHPLTTWMLKRFVQTVLARGPQPAPEK